MFSGKDILMTTATSVITLGFIASTVLHFTPWPHHNQDREDTLYIPCYTTNEYPDREKVTYPWYRKKLPDYVCIKENEGSEPLIYPTMSDVSKKEQTSSTHKTALNTLPSMYFIDKHGVQHHFQLRQTIHSDWENAGNCE